MTAPGRYAASDGSFAKSAGSAAARGGVLIALAVVIGFALLMWGFDGGESDAAVGPSDDSSDSSGDDQSGDSSGGDDQSGDGSTPDDTSDANGDGDETTTTEGDGDPTGDDTSTTTPVVVDDPSTIAVAVLNATGEPGLARTRAEALGALGYKWTAGNAAGSPLTDSKVYFVTGFGDEAGVVAAALSGPASVLELAPDDPSTLATEAYAADTANADIIVVLGTDAALT